VCIADTTAVRGTKKTHPAALTRGPRRWPPPPLPAPARRARRWPPPPLPALVSPRAQVAAAPSRLPFAAAQVAAAAPPGSHASRVPVAAAAPLTAAHIGGCHSPSLEEPVLMLAGCGLGAEGAGPMPPAMDRT
jgi:hypothetical protein